MLSSTLSPPKAFFTIFKLRASGSGVGFSEIHVSLPTLHQIFIINSTKKGRRIYYLQEHWYPWAEVSPNLRIYAFYYFLTTSSLWLLALCFSGTFNEKKAQDSLVVWFLPCSTNKISSYALLYPTVFFSHILPYLLIFFLDRGNFHVWTGWPGHSQQLHQRAPWRGWKWHECLKPWPEMDGIPCHPNHQCWCVVWGRKMAGSKVGGTPALSSHPLSAELQFAREVMSGFNIFGQIFEIFFVLQVSCCLEIHEWSGCGHGQERWWVPKQPPHCLVGLRTGLPSFSPWGFGFLLLPMSQCAWSQNKYCTTFLWKTQGISAVSHSHSSE